MSTISVFIVESAAEMVMYTLHLLDFYWSFLNVNIAYRP